MENIKCFECNVLLGKHAKIYRGFDTNFCSDFCRKKIEKLNSKIDPAYIHCDLWNTKPLKKSNSLLSINTNINTNSSIDSNYSDIENLLFMDDILSDNNNNNIINTYYYDSCLNLLENKFAFLRYILQPLLYYYSK